MSSRVRRARWRRGRRRRARAGHGTGRPRSPRAAARSGRRCRDRSAGSSTRPPAGSGAGRPSASMANASSIAAGVSRPWSSPGRPRMTALVNSDVAPPSLRTMWALSWHSTAPHGGHSADSPSALAAVPDTTGNTATSSCSNTSATRSMQAGRPRISAVRHRSALVGGGDGGEDLRRHADRVVAAQFDAGGAERVHGDSVGDPPRRRHLLAVASSGGMDL